MPRHKGMTNATAGTWQSRRHMLHTVGRNTRSKLAASNIMRMCACASTPRTACKESVDAVGCCAQCKMHSSRQTTAPRGCRRHPQGPSELAAHPGALAAHGPAAGVQRPPVLRDHSIEAARELLASSGAYRVIAPAVTVSAIQTIAESPPPRWPGLQWYTASSAQ